MAELTRATPADLTGDPVALAPWLLGGVFRVADVAVRLTEVEAYCGLADPGSHAYRRITPRTRVMAGEPGHIYVYFSYGMHHAVNIVAHEAGDVGAILLRAGEIIEGIEVARERRIELRLARKSRPSRASQPARASRDAGPAGPLIPDAQLARGPGNLAAALGLTRADDGAPLSDHYALWLPTQPPGVYLATGRTGVSGVGGDPERYPWRFAPKGDPTVSAYRRAAPRTLRP